MRTLATLLRKEMLATFGSPIAYTVAAVFPCELLKAIAMTETIANTTAGITKRSDKPPTPIVM